MKITPKAAPGFLASPAQAKACLLYGPDSGLVRERAQMVKKAILGENHDPFALVELEEAKLLDDHALLADELRMVSMMAPKRLILIRDGGDKLTALLRESQAYLNDDAFLLVTAGELSTRSPLRAWFESEPQAAALACYHDEARDVEAVIRRTLGNAGIEMGRDVMEYLIQQLGNDRYVTYQELEKLITFCGAQKRIHLEEAQALIDYNQETGLDDIVGAAADKNLTELDRMLSVQLKEGVQPVAYLRALQRYFGRLYWIKAQMAQGQSMEAVIAGLKPKVFYKQEEALKRHIRSWELANVVKAIGLLINAELACKTSDLPVVAASSRKLMQLTQLR